MNWYSHLTFGVILYAITIFLFGFFNYQLELLTIVAGAIITVPYSLLPDIDHDMSKISQLVEILFLGTSLASIISYFYFKKEELIILTGFLIGVIFITKFLKHRGITHTIRFGIVASIPLVFADPLYALFAFIAFTSHLVADLHIKL